MEWHPLDLRDDPEQPHYDGDPADLLDAASFVAELLRRPAWHARAACAGKGIDPFYPSSGQSADPAREVCAGCPVTAECLRAALEVGAVYDVGVWGGTSAKERRRLRRSTEVEAA